MVTISECIADYVFSLQRRDIPEDVVRHVELLLVDSFGIALSTREQQAVKMVCKEALSSPGPVSLWGITGKTTVADALLADATMIHAIDYDDTHVAGIVHPSAIVVTTGVVVGELVHASGSEIVTAMVAGYEVAIRLALAAKGKFHDVGYHGTGIVASFASACVAAKLLHLDKVVLVNALGICGSQSAGLQQFLKDGSWTKKIHPGWGCHSAWYALSLAKQGFVGPKEVFEGTFGLFKTHINDVSDLIPEFSNLGKVWHTREITIKLFPVCHMTHAFIDCASSLAKKYRLDPKEIRKVECKVGPRCYEIVCNPPESKRFPQNTYLMRFSLYYIVAMAILHGFVGNKEIDLAYLKDPEVVGLMKKVDCIKDESCVNPGYFPGYVRIIMNNGQEYELSRKTEPGTVENPIKEGQVFDKFEKNLDDLYSKERWQAIKRELLAFDTLGSVDSLLSLFIQQE